MSIMTNTEQHVRDYSGMKQDDKAFFTGKREPWHAYTATAISADVTSAAQAIALAGLDWNVTRNPVHTYYNGEAVTIEGKKALVREDTGKVLSVMSDTYRVVQNREAFTFVDDILGGPDLRFNAGGSLHNGARVWLSAEMDRDIFIGGDKDEQIAPYIMLANSHDGTLSVSCWITPIRIACQNALTYSMREAKRTWKARHTANVMTKVGEARQMLGIASRYFDSLQEIGDALIAEKVSPWRMNKMIADLFPMPEGKRVDEVEDGRAKTLILNRREAVAECLKADDLANVKDTAWGFVQAVADWDDHHRTAKNTDVRMNRVLFGEGSYKDRSLTIARDLIAA